MTWPRDSGNSPEEDKQAISQIEISRADSHRVVPPQPSSKRCPDNRLSAHRSRICGMRLWKQMPSISSRSNTVFHVRSHFGPSGRCCVFPCPFPAQTVLTSRLQIRRLLRFHGPLELQYSANERFQSIPLASIIPPQADLILLQASEIAYVTNRTVIARYRLRDSPDLKPLGPCGLLHRHQRLCGRASRFATTQKLIREQAL